MTVAAEHEAFALGVCVEANRRQLDPQTIARLARLTTATVANVMGGTLAPCPRIQQLISQALGTTPAGLYLLGGHE